MAKVELTYPSKYPEVIAVGATDENDERWYYSNYGPELDVVAPSGGGYDEGVIMWTTDISGDDGCNPNAEHDPPHGDVNGDYYQWSGGTSSATPEVAGLAGLILSVNSNLTSDQVQFIIERTSDDKGDPGRDDYYGWGRINVYKAMDSLYNFCVKNSSDEPVAWFDSFGNLFLEGSLTERGGQTRPTATEDDEFIFKDSSGNLMIINTTNGNMDIYGEYMDDAWPGPGPGPSELEDEFVIEGPSGAVAYINASGNLYLEGELYEQNP